MAQNLPADSRDVGDAPPHGRRRRRVLPAAAPTVQTFPNNWLARPYQRAVINAYTRGLRRFWLPWHRRAGKDNLGMNFARERMDAEIGAYWHLLPKLTQAKRAIWNGIDDRSGKTFIDLAFPEPWRVYKNDADLLLRAHNGSTWQLGGSDSYDRLVGGNPRGVVLSEWALADPMAWEYLRPILVENGGWVMFITTFRGKNHAFQQWRKLQGNPDWYLDLRTVDNTTRVDGSPVVTAEAIDKERRDGMSEAMIRQEFYCDPIAARPGAIYGQTMTELLEAKRATRVGYDATIPVTAAWNLDHMPASASVVFFQELGNEVAVIGSRSWLFTPISQCLAELDAFPWESARHLIRIDDEGVWPELFRRAELKVELAREHGEKSKAAAMAAAMLERTYIDTTPRDWLEPSEVSNNELLIDSLNGYRLKELEEGQFGDSPVVSYERYLTGAVELFASWHWRRARAKSKPLDYSAHDRAVI